jgi:hypothetical protein
MANEQSRYNGDDYHPILHTGNLVEGDQIAFDHPVYERGSQGPPVFRGFYRVSGRVSHIRLGAKAHQDKITITPDNGGAQISINAKTLKDVAIYRTPGLISLFGRLRLPSRRPCETSMHSKIKHEIGNR